MNTEFNDLLESLITKLDDLQNKLNTIAKENKNLHSMIKSIYAHLWEEEKKRKRLAQQKNDTTV